MKLSNPSIRHRILKKLVYHNLWGGKHTAYDSISRGASKDTWKLVRDELDLLIKEGFIILKPTGYGLHVSLNMEKKAEIEAIVFPSGSAGF